MSAPVKLVRAVKTLPVVVLELDDSIEPERTTPSSGPSDQKALPEDRPYELWFDACSERCLSLDEMQRLYEENPEVAQQYYCVARLTYAEFLNLTKHA